MKSFGLAVLTGRTTASAQHLSYPVFRGDNGSVIVDPRCPREVNGSCEFNYTGLYHNTSTHQSAVFLCLRGL